MKLQVNWTCPACGLWTPSHTEIPDGLDPRQPLRLGCKCHHCGADMEKIVRADKCRSGEVEVKGTLTKKEIA